MSEIAEKIIELLLQVPEHERGNVCEEIRYNHVFCWHCGSGSRERPNTNCQCWNDE